MKIISIEPLTLIRSNYPSTMFWNKVAKKEVFDFKEKFCDENIIIINAIKKNLLGFFKSPILDVGAGTGDIAYKALANKSVLLIDVNRASKHDYPCRVGHSRKKVDFFDFQPSKKINTLLISHTLQFIDDDIQKLNEKIKALNPEYIITVLNANDDFMGDLIQWGKENFPVANPEIRIDGFPLGYKLVKTLPFKATLKCPDFESLAKQVSYLLLIDIKKAQKSLTPFLKRHLREPSFIFNQSIDVYHKL